MASRRRGRILAFQALYSWEVSYNTGEASPSRTVPEAIFDFSWLESEKRAALDEATRDFSRLLIAGTIENIRAVDRMIKAHLKNWDFSRLNRVDLALLRLSVYTLLFQTDIPPSIVIDEAIGISKEFGTDDSFRFINGVLDSIRKTIQDSRKPEDGTPPPGATPPPDEAAPGATPP